MKTSPNPRRFAGPALTLLILVSALAVIFSTHRCRQYYAHLQDLEARRWQLDEQFSRLLLETSTLASPHRVSAIAQDQLGMGYPELSAARVIH